MARFNLARMAKRSSRRPITFLPIVPPAAKAIDLAAIYQRVVATWRAALPGILAAYEQALDQALTKDSADDAAGMIDSAAEAIRRLVLMLTPDLRDWAIRYEEFHRLRWVRNVLSAASVDLSTIIGPSDAQETVAASVQRNVSLVRDISEQSRQRISEAVFRGLQARTPAREVGKEMAEAVGMARKRANRVAADQLVKLSSTLDRQRQRQAGLDHWKWRHSGKLHPREAHKARDGKVYTDETAPADEPGELPFCGCVRQAVLVFTDE